MGDPEVHEPDDGARSREWDAESARLAVAAVRERAVAAVRDLVAPGGTLFVVENVRAEGVALPERPPWPLSRAEIASFAHDGLAVVAVAQVDHGARWRAEFARPGAH